MNLDNIKRICDLPDDDVFLAHGLHCDLVTNSQDLADILDTDTDLSDEDKEEVGCLFRVSTVDGELEAIFTSESDIAWRSSLLTRVV